MADEPVVTDPAEEARAARAEAAEAKKQAAAEAKRAKEIEAQYATDMQKVAAYLEQQRTAQQPAPPAAEPEDEGSFVTRKDIRSELERVRGEAQQMLAEETRQTLSQQRHYNRQAVVNDPYYAKYKDEIEEALNQVEKMNPRAAAQPGAYAEAIKLAKARHLDEIEAEIRERTQAEFLASHPRGVEEDEEAEETRPASPHATTRPAPAASPGGPSSARPVSLVRSATPEPLDPKEDRIRRRMGFSVDDWRSAKDDTVEHDPFGFKNRARV